MLKELELYDNQITVIENLSTLVNLEYVFETQRAYHITVLYDLITTQPLNITSQCWTVTSR